MIEIKVEKKIEKSTEFADERFEMQIDRRSVVVDEFVFSTPESGGDLFCVESGRWKGIQKCGRRKGVGKRLEMVTFWRDEMAGKIGALTTIRQVRIETTNGKTLLFNTRVQNHQRLPRP